MIFSVMYVIYETLRGDSRADALKQSQSRSIIRRTKRKSEV